MARGRQYDVDAVPRLLKPAEPCSACPFYIVTHYTKKGPVVRHGTGFCEPEGYPYLGVAFCAEASGEHEEIDGLPLRPYAQAGSMHTRTLRSLFIQRAQTYMFNVLACRPPNNYVGGAAGRGAIQCCRPIRESRIDYFRSEASKQPGVAEPVIVALGDVAFQELTGIPVGATAEDDDEAAQIKKMSISYVRGYPVRTRHGVVVPTFHPAFVRRNTKLMYVLAEDYRKAFRIAHEGLNVLPVNSIVNPSESVLRDLRDRCTSVDPNDPGFWLIFDFETELLEKGKPRHWTPPLRSVQFSLGPQHAIYVDWRPENFQIIREILGTRCRKAGHNVYDFDLDVARNNGIDVGGVVDDSLFMFHHYQPDLTIEDSGTEAGNDYRYSTAAGLQYVASFYGADSADVLDPSGRQLPGWKHLRFATDERLQALYGNLDVANNARILYGCKGLPSLPQQLRDKGIWDGYDRYVRQFYPILQRAADRGVPIDRQGQWAMDHELAVIQIQIDKKIQKIHPNILKRTEPKAGYVKAPKEGPKIKKVYLEKA